MRPCVLCYTENTHKSIRVLLFAHAGGCQSLALALALADRAYVIEAGRIVASGTPDEIAGNDALERAYLGTA